MAWPPGVIPVMKLDQATGLSAGIVVAKGMQVTVLIENNLVATTDGHGADGCIALRDICIEIPHFTPASGQPIGLKRACVTVARLQVGYRS